MIVTHKVSMNLDGMDQEQCLQIMQHDENSRVLEMSLYENGVPWSIPEGVTVALQYLKPDGSGGSYDTLEDGSPAWHWEENVVTVHLSSVLADTAGVVYCTLVLRQEEAVLHSFSVRLLVKPGLSGMGASGGSGGGCMLGGLRAQVGELLRVSAVNAAGGITALETLAPEAVGLPQPEQAAVGQCILVSAVDESGRVTATRAVDPEILEDAEGVAF